MSAFEAAELAGDLAAAFRLPFPHFVDEGVAAEIGAGDALLREVALDHHLGGDAGMIGADHPERILPLQARVADQDILQRIVERVADMERAGDVGRRDDDGEGLRRVARGAELAGGFPMRVPAGFDGGGIESLVDGHIASGFRESLAGMRVRLESRAL